MKLPPVSGLNWKSWANALTRALEFIFTDKEPLFGGWRDMVSPFSTAKTVGTNDPAFTDMGNGIYALKFIASDRVFVYYHVDHDYKVGSKAYPHVHWCMDATPTASETVTWRISYVQAKGHSQGESLTAATTSFDVTYTCTGSEVAGEHIISECSDAQAFELCETDGLVLVEYKLFSETATPNIYGLMGDLHYQVDKHATPQKSPDFMA